MREPLWMRITLWLRLARLVRFLRRDTEFVPACERPSDDDGLRMVVLARRARRQGFDLRRMAPRESVLIEDVAFNALLAVANQSLERIARELDARDRCPSCSTASGRPKPRSSSSGTSRRASTTHATR